MADTNGASSPNSAKDLEIVEVADEYKELEDEDDVEEATYEEEIEDPSDDKGNVHVEETASEEKDDIADQASDVKEEALENENEQSDNEKGNSDKDENGSDKTKEVDKNDPNIKSDTSSTDNRDIRSRVFIGHLNTEKCTRRDLEKLFKPCGKIMAISVLNGYGFIQFDNEESARKAIDDIHGTPFFDMKLVVDKPSAWKKLDGESTKDTKPWPKDPKKPFVPDKRGGRRDRDRGRDYRDKRDRRDRERRRYDYEDYYAPSRYRDIYYDRYLEMRYMEERMAAERYYDRYYDRYSALGMGSARSRYDDLPLSGRGYDYYGSSYDRPRDDDYDRERRPFDSYGFH